MSIVVDLPAPFGPSSATVSPGATETSSSRTACTGPCGVAKDLARPSSRMPWTEELIPRIVAARRALR